MKSRQRIALPILVLVLTITFQACTSGVRAPESYTVGRNLVATVKVLSESDEFDYPGGGIATGVILEVQAIHWVGHPQPWIVEVPSLSAGQQIRALRLPKSAYQVGHVYVASFNFINDPAYGGFDWWLSAGMDEDGNVITNKGDAAGYRHALDLADGADGDNDGPAELLAGYAAEWEALLNARDRGVPETELPFGPMLAAIYGEYGLDVSDATTPAADYFVAASPEQRILPSDYVESQELLDAVGPTLKVQWTQVEGMVIHGSKLEGTYSLGLWFDGIGRTGESVIDHETGVTILRSVVPAGHGFKLVGFPIPEDDKQSSRTWDDIIATVDEQIPIQPPAAGGALSVPVGNDSIYFLLDLREDLPSIMFVAEDDYFQLVLDMEPLLGSRGATGSEQNTSG